jgi:hypothetical protein
MCYMWNPCNESVLMDVTSRVLTIEEVKQKMKDIRTVAVHYGGVVHCGERGRDELVIVSSRRWEEVTGQTGAEVREMNPYGAFARALQSGRLGAGNGLAEPRRRMPGLATESGLTVEEMARLGAEEDQPRRRRTES